MYINHIKNKNYNNRILAVLRLFLIGILGHRLKLWMMIFNWNWQIVTPPFLQIQLIMNLLKKTIHLLKILIMIDLDFKVLLMIFFIISMLLHWLPSQLYYHLHSTIHLKTLPLPSHLFFIFVCLIRSDFCLL